VFVPISLNVIITILCSHILINIIFVKKI
jgi:hypothetical protein